MSAPNDAVLRARLVRLERTARRDRVLALGVLALFFATAQAPAAPPGNVVTDPSGANARIVPTGLIVRDSANKVRVAAWIDDNGSPSFDESEASGELRQSMYLFKGTQAAQLEQYDPTGKRRDEIYVAGDTQNPELALLDENRTIRLEVFRATGGNAEIALRGSDGNSRGFIEADERTPWLGMRDRTGKTRVYVGAYEDGSIGMDVRNATGESLWQKP